MDSRTAIFYLALIVIAGCAAELYVRMKGMGDHVEKLRGVIVAKKPDLFPTMVPLVAAIIVAAMTIPH
ncbi:MAG: hypothetical protein Q7J42_09485 [Sulfuritalea sp.]|nr:hypothetical protein [Sulfuritalea sp.]